MEEVGQQTSRNFYNFFKLTETVESENFAPAKPLSSVTLKVRFIISERFELMPENSFDIVSKIELQEVSNAIQQAMKEIHTRST